MKTKIIKVYFFDGKSYSKEFNQVATFYDMDTFKSCKPALEVQAELDGAKFSFDIVNC